MKCSICMATRNKAVELDRTLRSIREQDVPFSHELVVVDDGSTDDTEAVCGRWGVDCYVCLENEGYRNPALARNEAYREARGDIILAQSDDVVHVTPDAIERLVGELHQGEFVIATVLNWHMTEKKQWNFPIPLLTGVKNKRPFFFLGAVWRRDVYAIGGNSEDFVAPAFDDDWFGDCLTKGIGLRARYLPEVVGHHQHHDRPARLALLCRPSKHLYHGKRKAAERGEIKRESVGGPWPYHPGKSYYDIVGREDE